MENNISNILLRFYFYPNTQNFIFPSICLSLKFSYQKTKTKILKTRTDSHGYSRRLCFNLYKNIFCLETRRLSDAKYPYFLLFRLGHMFEVDLTLLGFIWFYAFTFSRELGFSHIAAWLFGFQSFKQSTINQLHIFQPLIFIPYNKISTIFFFYKNSTKPFNNFLLWPLRACVYRFV